MSNVTKFPGPEEQVPAEVGQESDGGEYEEVEFQEFYLPYVAMAFCRAVQEGDLDKAKALHIRLGRALSGDQTIYLDDMPWAAEYVESTNAMATLFHNEAQERKHD